MTRCYFRMAISYLNSVINYPFLFSLAVYGLNVHGVNFVFGSNSGKLCKLD
jgi:hypothetical protein